MGCAKCKNCGNMIDRVVMSQFLRDGSDSDSEYAMIGNKEVPFVEVPENAVYMETDGNWTGYELTEEEMAEDIRCPVCGKFPFEGHEVQVYDVVRVVCFKDGEPETENAPDNNVGSKTADEMFRELGYKRDYPNESTGMVLYVDTVHKRKITVWNDGFVQKEIEICGTFESECLTYSEIRAVCKLLDELGVE